MKLYINIINFLASLLLFYLNTNLKTSLPFSLAILSTNFLYWIAREKKVGPINWFNPIFLFNISYFIVFFQIPIMIFLGHDLYKTPVSYYDPELISYCLSISLTGICAFYLGEEIFNNYFKRIKRRILENNLMFVKPVKGDFIKGFLILGILISHSLFIIENGGLRNLIGFEYGKGGVFFKGKVDYYGLFTFILIHVLIIFEIDRLISCYKIPIKEILRKVDKKVIIIVLFIIASFFVSGDRGSALELTFILIGPYFILSKRLDLKSALIILIMASFIMSSVGLIRSSATHEYLDELKYKVDNISEYPLWPTYELAGSFWTFYIAVDLFPNYFNYTAGKKLLFNIFSLFPFSSRIFHLAEINEKENYIYSSSLFFTNIINRGKLTSGAGTSLLADAYMEYGIISTIIYLFLIGVLLAWSSVKVHTKQGYLTIYFYSYLCYFSIYISRSSLLFGWEKIIISILFYSLIRFYAFKKAIRYKK